ncbi:MAG TPA: alpha/beta hydrolase [Candidatus Thermoplasmatota archaeon]|nr:alpha/beta hydrolase [Candidatus Thermoplasmatota archaeon]
MANAGGANAVSGATPSVAHPARPGDLDADWSALWEELEAIPHHPSPLSQPRTAIFRLRRGLDFIAHVRFRPSRAIAHLRPYPPPFRHVEVPSEGGVTIAGWLGPQHRTSPSPWGIILVPGLFSTKDDSAHRGRAIKMWQHWRIPLMAIDLRGFGESGGINSAGWKEGHDVLACARFLAAETGVKRVAVVAESLGGAAALNALALDGEETFPLLTAGVLCWSPFMDARDAVTYISEKPPLGHAFESAFLGFRRLLRIKSHGMYERFDAFLDDAARVYGLSGFEELCERASPKAKVATMRGPALIVHASDDPIVPVRHARRMERYATGRDNIHLLLTDWGGHTGFEPMEPQWYWELTSRYFGRLNGVRLQNLAGHV